MRKVDFLTGAPHYRDHLQPVWDALPPETRGHFVQNVTPGDRPVVVSSGEDSRKVRLRGRRAIRMEHGVGQSYERDAPGHESYPGGINQEHVRLFLAPNEQAADRWRERYPETPTFAIGCPKLDRWHAAPPKERSDRPVVAVSFHWDCRVSTATRSSFWEFREAVEELVERDDIELLGHWHPSAPYLEGWWRELNVPMAAHFDEVLAGADLYCADNSSTLFEFASLDRPVVRLKGRNQPDFEPPFMGVGIVTDPVSLDEAIDWALEDDGLVPEQRRRAVDELYPHRGDATNVAVEMILKELT